MQHRYFLFAVLLSAFLAAGVRAQGKFEGGPDKGARTTSVSGSVTYNAKDNYNATVRLELGYYASPSLEYAGVIAFNGQSSPAQQLQVVGGNTTAFQSASSSSGLAVGAVVRYHFGRSKIIPYVGFAPQYDVINISGSKTKQVVLIVTGGADFFIKPQESVFAELSAERFTRDSSTTARLEIGVKLFY
jgi:hypothetical protein